MAETPENHASEASRSDVAGRKLSPDDSSASQARQPLTGAFDFMVRGFRPAAGWACAIVILVRGAVVPLWELARGSDASPIDWAMLVALVGMLGLARYRHLEKTSGATV